MARPLSTHPMFKLSLLPAPASYLIILAAILGVFSIVTFLCGSHRTQKPKKPGGRTTSESSDQRLLSKMNSEIKDKAYSMVKMISGRRVQYEEEEEEEEDEDGERAIWRKTIIKGEKCRPLDFSGKILYDSEGNLAPEPPGRDRSIKTIDPLKKSLSH